MRYKFFFLPVVIVLSLYSVCAGQSNQSDSVTASVVHVKKVRNVIGFVPSKADVINGWAIGWLLPLELHVENKDSVRINGLYTSIGPAQALIVAFTPAFIPSIPSPKGILNPDSIYTEPVVKHALNGVAISFLEIGGEFSFQGVSLTATYQVSSRLNGISVSGLASLHEHLTGISIAGIKTNTYNGKGLQLSMINTATQFTGIQIGLSNNSINMRGVQIGLWNRIGRRGFPLINFRFR